MRWRHTAPHVAVSSTVYSTRGIGPGTQTPGTNHHETQSRIRLKDFACILV